MPKQTASDYAVVAAFIDSERRWRERVFAKDPAKLATKVADCDRAAAALRRLVGFDEPDPTPAPNQPSLF